MADSNFSIPQGITEKVSSLGCLGSFFKIIIPIWLSMACLGYIVGKIESPDFKNKNVVQDYLESNAWLFNRKDTTKVLPIVLLDIYRDRYVFGLKNDTIHLEKFNNVRYTPASFTVSDDEIQRYVISTGVIASSITFTRLSEIASMATRQNRTVKLSTAIAIVLGLGVGYKVGYKKMPDYDNPFLKDIIEDQDFWKGVIERKVFQRKEEIAANLPGAPEPAWYEKALGWLIFW